MSTAVYTTPTFNDAWSTTSTTNAYFGPMENDLRKYRVAALFPYDTRIERDTASCFWKIKLKDAAMLKVSEEVMFDALSSFNGDSLKQSLWKAWVGRAYQMPDGFEIEPVWLTEMDMEKFRLEARKKFEHDNKDVDYIGSLVDHLG